MKVNLNKIFSNSLIFFIAIYFCQGVLYPAGFIIGKICVLIIILISSFYLFKVFLLKINKSFFCYSWLALIILNTLGFLFEGRFDGIYFSQYRNILISLLPFFPFYYFGLKGYLTEEKLLRLFILMLPISILSFYSSKNNIIESQISNTDNFVSNTAYLFVALLPYIFLFGKRKIIAILSLLIIIFFIIQSAKRGALITASIGAIIFIYYQFSIIDAKKRMQGYIFSFFALILILKFSIDLYQSNEYLVRRIEKIDEGGSGRNVIYYNLWNNWLQSNHILNYLFGFGFVSTILYSGTGNLAHNDWLELLTNFGLLGVLVYLLVFLSMIEMILVKGIKKNSKLILICIFLMSIIKTIISMYYTSTATIFSAILLGYICSQYIRSRHNIIVLKD